MSCKFKLYTEGGYVWCCPRDAVTGGYCERHMPQGQFRIRFTWPEGKVRWCAGESITKHPERALVYTFADAHDIVENKYHDARLVWGIVTSMEPIT